MVRAMPKPISTLRTTTTPVKPAIVDPRPPKFATPKCIMTLPPNLGRPPTSKDLIIKKGFDGLTPDQGVAKIMGNLTSKLYGPNEAFVKQTASNAFRAFNVAMNNTIVPNSPNNAFVKSLGNQHVSLLATMSEKTVYKAVNPADGSTKYYAKDWTGNFEEMAKPPSFVVMEARIRVDPPGLVMKYPKWKHDGLSGPTSTITEL